MQINDPAILAEVRKMLDRYEVALTGNDVAALQSLFWDSALTVRYGAAETLYGAEAIAAFRAARPAGARPRQVLRTHVTSFGTAFATAQVEFRLEGDSALGLQSQSWVRLEAGWRIAAAHVSYIAAST